MERPSHRRRQESTLADEALVAEIVDRGHGSQALGGLLGGQVALRLAQQLVADHELAHGRRPQERRQAALGRVLAGCLDGEGAASPDLAVWVWGFEAPIASPLFSRTWTQRNDAPSAVVWSAHRSTIERTAAGDIRAIVRSWRGEKQMTRQVPRSPSARRRPISSRSSDVIRAESRVVVGEDERLAVGRRVKASSAG